MKILIFVLSILLGAPLAAQMSTDLAAFDKLRIFCRCSATLVLSEQERIEIEGDATDVERVKVTQSGGSLKITTLRSLVTSDPEILMTIYYRQLSEISTGGGARLNATQALAGPGLTVRAGSGSEVFLEVMIEQLQGIASEGAHLTLKGKVESLEAGASSGGIVDAHQLSSRRADLRASTGGEVSATVTESLTAAANTGGSVRYGGNPDQVQVKTLLGGEISPL